MVDGKAATFDDSDAVASVERGSVFGRIDRVLLFDRG
jgi:hypothetical protein